ncbi:MAG: response regulator [Saprospiraceae bacterium]
MSLLQFNILLADDDKDDCRFFKEALQELPLNTFLTVVHDGDQLMQLLTEKSYRLPHVLFLDLNMPLKNGSECLAEIKRHEYLKDLIVIIFSTSFEQYIATDLYSKGAQYYIRKPSDFNLLKSVIYKALILVAQNNISQPPIEYFVLKGETLPDQ